MRFSTVGALESYFRLWYLSNGRAATRCMPLARGRPVPAAITLLRNPRSATVPASQSRHPAVAASRQPAQPDPAEQARQMRQIEEGTRVWRPVRDQLELELGEPEFSLWIRPLQVTCTGDAVVLWAPNRYVRDKLTEQHLARIGVLLGSSRTIRVDIGSASDARASG